MILLVLALVFAEPSSIIGEASGPVAVTPEIHYRFTDVVEGYRVTHAFPVLNKGASELLIQRVRSGCSCSATSYTRRIPPGGEGRINVEIDTGNYGNQDLYQTFQVYTNDPKRTLFDLIVSGRVDPFADVHPVRVCLRGNQGERVIQTVRIAPRENHPFSIIEAKAWKDEWIDFKLDHDPEDKSYRLTIENTMTEPGNYTDRIYLRTDSEVKPSIMIQIYGRILNTKGM